MVVNMKKYFAALLLCLLFCLPAGCSTVRSALGAAPAAEDPSSAAAAPTATPEATAAPTAEPTAAPTAEPTLSPEALLDALRFHLDLLNQCYAETCGAELDLDHPYSRVYTSAQAMLDGEAPIDVVPQETVDHSNPTDPTDATLYEILNFKTNAEARAYLEQYMTPEMADALFPNAFCEMNGKLYMVYGSRGYGMHRLDPDSAALTASGETACTVTLDSYWFEEKGEPCTVSFEKQGDVWKITAVSGGEQP